MMWGGVAIWSHNPFFFHPFHPFMWGPMWHPWGFMVPMPPPQAQVVNVTNITNETNVTNVTNVITEFQYAEGVFYQKDEEGWLVVPAPIGAEVKSIPDNYEKVILDNNEINYYWGGAFYEKTANGYVVVPPTAGALVQNLSEGGEEVKMGDITYVRLGSTYYQPVQVKGKNMYEVVTIRENDDAEENE
jgi:hypothetical protein